MDLQQQHHHQSSGGGSNDVVGGNSSASSTTTNNNNNNINNNTNNDENVCQNMVSNLPLLFAGGYPTSLDKITENQLEKFIPFMVQCSLGYIQIHNNVEYNEPEWWPEDVPFSIPLVKQKEYRHTTWHAKLKEIVIICYQFHKGVFLLRFCNELASYQPECLRFINNYNSTTSLFDRVSNKLLVTFRNENMLYDQIPVNSKKTLLPRVPSSHQLTTSDFNTENMVEQALFDIYLCDNCEAELYSLDAYTEHEKTCLMDDDVIFCGTADYDGDDSGGGGGGGGGGGRSGDRVGGRSRGDGTGVGKDGSDIESDDPINDKLQQQSAFLYNFNLTNNDSTNSIINQHHHHHHNHHHNHLTQQSSITTKSPSKRGAARDRHQQKQQQSSIHSSPNRHSSPVADNNKMRRMPTRSRNVMVLAKCPTIPITSPAGLQLIKSAKTQINRDYLLERLDRTERFCPAPLLYNSKFSVFGSSGSSVHNRPKFMDKRFNYSHISCTYKRPPATLISMASSGIGGNGGSGGGGNNGSGSSVGSNNFGGCNFGGTSSGYSTLQTNQQQHHQSSSVSVAAAAASLSTSKSSNINKISVTQYRDFKWPRRQFSQINRERAFLWFNANKLKTCVPLEIRLKKITQADIDDYLYQSKCQRLLKEQEQQRLHQQQQQQQQQQNKKVLWMTKKAILLASTRKESTISPIKRTKIVDIIDLCSSDDENGNDNDNSDELNKIKNNNNRKKVKYQTNNVTTTETVYPTTIASTLKTISTSSSPGTIAKNFGFDAKSGIEIHKINPIDPLKLSQQQQQTKEQLLSTDVRPLSPPPPSLQPHITPIKLRKVHQSFTTTAPAASTTVTPSTTTPTTAQPIIINDGGLSSQQAISPTVITPLNISQSRNIYHSTFPTHGLLIFKKSPLIPHHSGGGGSGGAGIGGPQDSITGVATDPATNSNCDLDISPKQQQQQPSVFLFSKLNPSPISLTSHCKSSTMPPQTAATITSTTLTESSSTSSAQLSQQQNQENNFSFLNGGTITAITSLPSSTTNTTTTILSTDDDKIKFNNLSINNNRNNTSSTTTTTSSSNNNKKILSMIGPDVIIERIEPTSTTAATVRSSRIKNDDKKDSRSHNLKKQQQPTPQTSLLPPPQISIDLT